MKEKVPILEATKHDRVWLKELYERGLKGDSFEIKDIWAKLHEKLPVNYRPQQMDYRLISSSGEKITIMGVIALQGNYTIFKKVNKTINAIRKVIMDNPKATELQFSIIENETGFSLAELNFYFSLSNDYAYFFNGGSLEHNSLRYTTIRVDGTIDIFYNYKEFPGMEVLILNSISKKTSHEEYFNDSEKLLLDHWLDDVQEGLKELKLGQEIIWTDLTNEMDELKGMYYLSKKSFRQIFIGKIFEMILSGIISDTVSKTVIAFSTAQINKLLQN